MNEADRRLRAVANMQAKMLVPQAVIMFGLSLGTYGMLERLTGAMHTMVLIALIVQTVGWPAMCLLNAASLRRAVRNAEAAQPTQPTP